jgi:hypothetical protein
MYRSWSEWLTTDEAEEQTTPLLRAAGCHCWKPLLGWRPGVGPRCRTCNKEAKWPEPQQMELPLEKTT